MRADEFWKGPAPLGNAILRHFPATDAARADWLWRQMDRVWSQLRHLAGMPGDKRKFFCQEMARLASQVLIPGAGPQYRQQVLDAVDEIFTRAHLVLPPGTQRDRVTRDFFESARMEPNLAHFMHRQWQCVDETIPSAAGGQ
jgi:hypothetical protein